MTRHDDDNLAPNMLATEHFQEIVARVAADPARRRLLKAGSGVAAIAGWFGLTGTSAVAGALAKTGPGARPVTMPVTMPDAVSAADAVLGYLAAGHFFAVQMSSSDISPFDVFSAVCPARYAVMTLSDPPSALGGV